MLTKIKEQLDDFDIYELNNFYVIISFFLIILSIYLTKNIYLIFFLYLFTLYISVNFEKNTIKFICFLLPVVILGYYLIQFINLSFIGEKTFYFFRFIIKLLLIIDHIIIIITYLKTKETKLTKLIKKIKKYTFKELRKKNKDKFQDKVNKDIESYLEKYNIDLDSDYFKVIESNIDNKVNNELEDYVRTEYLRFYKNQSLYKQNLFNICNIIYLLIHIIIFIVVLIVR